jgi:hypothetical protein
MEAFPPSGAILLACSCNVMAFFLAICRHLGLAQPAPLADIPSPAGRTVERGWLWQQSENIAVILDSGIRP